MKLLILFTVIVGWMKVSEAGTSADPSLAIGTPMPNLTEEWAKMEGLDGKKHTLQSVKGEKGTLVVFTCVHCPYVKAWDERLVALVHEFKQKGVNTIWINPNDLEASPQDRPEHMKKQVASLGLNSAVPYVIDSTSNVARAFGATRTPEIFLFNAENALVYKGAIDSSHQQAPPRGSDRHFLRIALNALVNGKEIKENATKSVGCTIKFRDQKSQKL